MIPTRPTTIFARWQTRFADAFNGLAIAMQDQDSLWVHLAVAVLVIALATILQIELWRWCAAIICIAMVISLELMNSAIERLVKTLHPEHDAGLAMTLHMAAASVLVAALAAVVVGLVIFLPPILRLL